MNISNDQLLENIINYVENKNNIINVSKLPVSSTHKRFLNSNTSYIFKENNIRESAIINAYESIVMTITEGVFPGLETETNVEWDWEIELPNSLKSLHEKFFNMLKVSTSKINSANATQILNNLIEATLKELDLSILRKNINNDAISSINNIIDLLYELFAKQMQSPEMCTVVIILIKLYKYSVIPILAIGFQLLWKILRESIEEFTKRKYRVFKNRTDFMRIEGYIRDANRLTLDQANNYISQLMNLIHTPQQHIQYLIMKMQIYNLKHEEAQYVNGKSLHKLARDLSALAIKYLYAENVSLYQYFELASVPDILDINRNNDIFNDLATILNQEMIDSIINKINTTVNN